MGDAFLRDYDGIDGSDGDGVGSGVVNGVGSDGRWRYRSGLMCEISLTV